MTRADIADFAKHGQIYVLLGESASIVPYSRDSDFDRVIMFASLIFFFVTFLVNYSN